MSWSAMAMGACPKGTLLLGVVFLLNVALRRAPAATLVTYSGPPRSPPGVPAVALNAVARLPGLLVERPLRWGFPGAGEWYERAPGARIRSGNCGGVPLGGRRFSDDTLRLRGPPLMEPASDLGGWRTQPLESEAWDGMLASLSDRLGISRRVRLLQGEPAAIPFTLGLFRPSMLLPPEARNWTPERRQVVLLHELAHVSVLEIGAVHNRSGWPMLRWVFFMNQLAPRTRNNFTEFRKTRMSGPSAYSDEENQVPLRKVYFRLKPFGCR